MSDPASTVLFRRIRRRLNRSRVRALARRMTLEIARGRPFTCLLTGDAELRRLNRDFRRRDYPADVLSFPLRAEALGRRAKEAAKGPPGPLPDGRGSVVSPCASRRLPSRERERAVDRTAFSPLLRPAPRPADPLGDIAISVGRAAAQARPQGHPLEDEIGILMLHGLLHLLGYDHERDRGRMRRTESRWRKALGLPAGLVERGRP